MIYLKHNLKKMINRLNEIISYATGGKKSEFAHMMGWTPQYLHRIMSGETGLGIQPVKAILQRFPELDARWLILGEGSMLQTPPSQQMMDSLHRLLELEKYLPVMSGEEIRQLAAGRMDWDAATIEGWEKTLLQRKDSGKVVRDAMKRQGLCR